MIPRIIIRVENILIAAAACFMYFRLSELFYLDLSRWYLILLVWLSFDLSIIGYLINNQIGALIYNLVHNYILAFLLLIVGFGWYIPDLISVSLILTIHVGIDRAVGFGLKYKTNFKDTHIQKI